MRSDSTKGYLCVIAAAILWAGSGTVGKALFATSITPMDVVQVRATFGSVLVAVFFAFRARHLFRVRRRDLGFLILLGSVVMALVQLTYFTAISKIHVAAAILLQYLAPIMVALYSIFFWQERLTALKLLSLCPLYSPLSQELFQIGEIPHLAFMATQSGYFYIKCIGDI